MFTRFLHRPALAIVISLLILFMGGLAINVLPISQFPSVAPPSVRVSVSYPGASAKILVDSTMVLLEQAINGTPNMRYMMGDATSAGRGDHSDRVRARHGPECRGDECQQSGASSKEQLAAHRAA